MSLQSEVTPNPAQRSAPNLTGLGSRLKVIFGKRGCSPFTLRDQSPSRPPGRRVGVFGTPPPVPSPRSRVKLGGQGASQHRRQRDPGKHRTPHRRFPNPATECDGAQPPSDRCGSGDGGVYPLSLPGFSRGSHQLLPLRLPPQDARCLVQTSRVENQRAGGQRRLGVTGHAPRSAGRGRGGRGRRA